MQRKKPRFSRFFAKKQKRHISAVYEKHQKIEKNEKYSLNIWKKQVFFVLTIHPGFQQEAGLLADFYSVGHLGNV